jgi:Raf kinase inhibitor-like YbhB/YbcL family protein
MHLAGAIQFAFCCAVCSSSVVPGVAGTAGASNAGMTFQLTSSSFTHEQPIPARHTSDSEDVSPALRWTDPPSGTKSFALIVHDPDAPDPRAPKRDWVQWVLYDLPADTRMLAEGVKIAELPRGTREGRNDWGETGWRGPSPPIGRHRYFFELHALDSVLPDLNMPSRRDLGAAMKGHVLGTATLMGTYAKGGH